jgi:undecaprenyl phosphate-alpha-L-ara4FN deformylase
VERKFAVRVDIDTICGLVDGVPPMLDLCRKHGIKATFFSTVGTDTSSRAFLHRPNLGRHLSVCPLTKYGPRELLGSLVGMDFSSHAEEIRAIEEEGHELQLHCYNHLRWIKRIGRADLEEARALIREGIDAFSAITGRTPSAFASPGFAVTEAVLDAEESLGFKYASDYVREGDAIPFLTGSRSVLQIPVNAPLVEDLVAQGIPDDEIVRRIGDVVETSSLTVLYLHACYEPRCKADVLSQAMEQALDRATGTTLMEVYETWNPSG